MLGFNKNLSDAEIKRKRRRENEQVALEKQALRESSSSQKVELADSDSENDRCSSENIVTPKKRKSVRYVGAFVTIPPDILSRPAVVAAAARMNINIPSEQALLTEVIVKESGGDASCIKGSYAVAARLRKSVSETIAKDIRSSWIAPTAAILHWDGKQIATLTDTSKREERQPVLVGNSESTKLLGVARYKPATDETKPPKLIQQSI